MVKVSIEVRSGAAHPEVGVRAESIQRAVSFVKERLNYLADELGVLPLDKRNLGQVAERDFVKGVMREADQSIPS